MNLWIVGKCGQTELEWEFMGVFSTEDAAKSACGERFDLWIAPAVLDEALPYETMEEWPGAYFPFVEAGTEI